jgi:hypothetical protein
MLRWMWSREGRDGRGRWKGERHTPSSYWTPLPPQLVTYPRPGYGIFGLAEGLNSAPSPAAAGTGGPCSSSGESERIYSARWDTYERVMQVVADVSEASGSTQSHESGSEFSAKSRDIDLVLNACWKSMNFESVKGNLVEVRRCAF